MKVIRKRRKWSVVAKTALAKIVYVNRTVLIVKIVKRTGNVEIVAGKVDITAATITATIATNITRYTDGKVVAEDVTERLFTQSVPTFTISFYFPI